MMEEKPGLGLQSGRAIDALIRVGTIKQPVCNLLSNTLSPDNYLPVAQKLSDSSDFFSNLIKKQQTNKPQIHLQHTDLCLTLLSLPSKPCPPCFCRAEESCAASALIKAAVTVPNGTMTPNTHWNSRHWAPFTGQRAPDKVNVD